MKEGLRIRSYSIQELEAVLSPEEKINKQTMSELLVSIHPVLSYEFHGERGNRNPYHVRMFEAVALGVVCCYQLENH